MNSSVLKIIFVIILVSFIGGISGYALGSTFGIFGILLGAINGMLTGIGAGQLFLGEK